MNTMTELLRRQVTGYALTNMEWRLSIQDFIDYYTNNGHWEALIAETGPVLQLFDNEDNLVDQLSISPVGSYNPNTKTWLWAWANNKFSPLTARRSSTIQRYGQQYNIPELTQPQTTGITENEAEAFSIITTAVYGGTKPVIWLPSSKGNLCVIIEDELTLPPVTSETFANALSMATTLPEEFLDAPTAITDYSENREFDVEHNQQKHTITTRFEDHTFCDTQLDANNHVTGIKYSAPPIPEEENQEESEEPEEDEEGLTAEDFMDDDYFDE